MPHSIIYYEARQTMNDMNNILVIIDDQTPTHIVDAVVCAYNLHR